MSEEFIVTFDVGNEKIFKELTHLFLSKIKHYDLMMLPERFDKEETNPERIAEYLTSLTLDIFIKHAKTKA